MRKVLLLFVLSLVLILSAKAQEINKTMIDQDINREILIGQVDETGLQNPVFVEDWNLALVEYTPDKIVVKKLRKIFRKNKDIRIKVFFASWCGDSKEYIPLFVKLAEKVKIKNVEYIALSRKKTLPNKDISNFEIHYVPTFIIYKGEKELGRIIETPEVSLEKDLLEIVSK